MSKIKNWVKGTGSYEVKEYALEQGELVTNGNMEGADNPKFAGISIQFTNCNDSLSTEEYKSGSKSLKLVSTINDSYMRFYYSYNSTAINVGKKVKYSFDVYVPSSSNNSVIQVYMNGVSAEQVVDVGFDTWVNISGTYTYIGTEARTLDIRTANPNTKIEDIVYFDNLSVVEIPPLPDFGTGTKYLENTTAGTIKLQADLESFTDNGYIYIDRYNTGAWTRHEDTVSNLNSETWFDYTDKVITLTGAVGDRFANIKIYNGVKQ